MFGIKKSFFAWIFIDNILFVRLVFIDNNAYEIYAQFKFLHIQAQTELNTSTFLSTDNDCVDAP